MHIKNQSFYFQFSQVMDVVNSVFRGKLTFTKPSTTFVNNNMRLNLESIYNMCQHNGEDAKLYSVKPKQLRIRHNMHTTVLLFDTGTFRVMGKCDEIDALLAIHAIFFQDDTIIIPGSLILQTMTMRGRMGHEVNLYTLSSLIQSVYEFELFTALRITKYLPMCVNVFGSGACVITGCKDIDKANEIFNEVDILCKKYCTVPKYCNTCKYQLKCKCTYAC